MIFGRGFFCPRDQQQFRQLVTFQDELSVNYGKLVTVNVDPPIVNAAFRAGLGANGLPVAEGSVLWFDGGSGNGIISRADTDESLFFNFTAIPGEGNRVLRAGTPVRFEVVARPHGATARNVQTAHTD